MGQFGDFLKVCGQCYQTGQFQKGQKVTENTNIENLNVTIWGDFQTPCPFLRRFLRSLIKIKSIICLTSIKYVFEIKVKIKLADDKGQG